MDKIKILILAANPWETKRLGLDDEYQRIQELWESSEYQEHFELRYYPALRGEALQEKVLKFKPHLIHFSGHGESDSLVFADLSGDNPYEVTKQALAQLFKLCAPDLNAVFLNACYSANQAEAIVEQVPSVIGMNAAIDDLAAISFSQGFYTAIFSQTELNIEQAFNAGLSQMAIARIPEKEQRKPVLQKRRQTFVPSFKHDIFISFADADKDWAVALIEYLRKQLKQKLYPIEELQLYADNDFNQLAQSALSLIITSPAYYQQYQSQLEQLTKQAKQQPFFWVDYEAIKSPECLKNTLSTPCRFYNASNYDTLPNDEYFAKADELALLISKCLIKLKDQHQHQQQITEQRQQQQQSRPPTLKNIDAFVFLHSAPEDVDLSAKIVPLLEDNSIDYVLPLKRSDSLSASEIRQDIENNILNCNAVLVLYEHTTPVWVREQLGVCRRLQRKRDKDNPLKIIAVHKNQEKPDLDFKIENLHIYLCPPQQIETYLEEFIEALTK